MPPLAASFHPKSLAIAASDPSFTRVSKQLREQLSWTSCGMASRGPDFDTDGGGKSGSQTELSDFLNFTVPNARRADLEPFAGALDEGAYRLQINIPPALGDVMSVADAVAKLRAATANFANLCHKTEIS